MSANETLTQREKSMYQIKFQCGYEIQVIGRGDAGLCRVVNSSNQIVYSGTYAACEKWLADRAVPALCGM
jgi:hypothetical protein